MIDWHSHILPGMDDGSRNVTESVALLNMQAAQGIRVAIATPHFYADNESVETFLDRRRSAYEALQSAWNDLRVKILLGAEVRYYPGISRMEKEELKHLRIEGSRVLLLEMPFQRWTDYMIRELIALSSISTLQIVLAHIERYLDQQEHGTWERLEECGILKQVNASFFISLASRRKALALLKKGSVQFVGSDCHNLTARPPRIGEAFAVIQKKLGNEFVSQMQEYGYSVLDAFQN
ncbi:MAG: capsular polysaccharide biosynthesis protein [Clostridia bacterium]|nr:capsular polysaccharide biosynthesis protein [Clostridia bacterium]